MGLRLTLWFFVGLFLLMKQPCVYGDELKTVGACDSGIFCDGPLLSAAQDAFIFNDSKTFVDLHLKYDPVQMVENISGNKVFAHDSDDRMSFTFTATVLSAFESLVNSTDKSVMKSFVEANFDGPAIEFSPSVPPDWKPSPAILEKIQDPELRAWASDLHHLWKDLGRQIKDDVEINNDQYSLMHVDNPFVVPGGRFREFYYWDSYWIIKGLLLSGMTETVKGMLSNFISMVDKIGFVPNGNRIYYQRRSQPPFLIPSVNDYLKATGDFQFVMDNLSTLQKEYEFWMVNRSVEVQKQDGGSQESYTLNRYNVFMGKPRPESYREDVETAAGLSEVDAAEVYSNLASAAESGWDFSSRWFGQEGTLSSIRTKQIVPVDLNSIMCLNERLLADFFERAGDTVTAAEFTTAYQTRRSAIQDVMWKDSTGVWLDYDLQLSATRDEFYLSNILPMWAGCYGSEAGGASKQEIDEKVLGYLKNEGVLDYPGGVPTSKKKNTGQQWDFPNAWPPLQQMLIEALNSSDLQEAKHYAFDLAQKWTLTNFLAYKENKVMYEKYDVTNQGVPGHGGEYGVQAGFGWTNGVIMTLLDEYGDSLKSDVPTTTPSSGGFKNHPENFTVAILISLSLVFSSYFVLVWWNDN